MSSNEYADGACIEHVEQTLRKLAEAQQPYLRKYYMRNSGVGVMFDLQGDNRPAFPLDDLRDLYATDRIGSQSHRSYSGK